MSIINQVEASESILEQINQIFTIANSIFAMVVIIIGLNWLKPLKEKQSAASFTFWSQMYIRLMKIYGYIKSNDKCLFYWYSPEARTEWQGILAPNQDEFEQLKAIIDETLSFLQDANDQMPAYYGWTDDYTKLLSYFTDMIVYDICDSEKNFKFHELTNYDDYLSLCQSICEIIKSMCSQIKNKQKIIEYKITVLWYKRFCNYFEKLKKKNKHGIYSMICNNNGL